MIIREGVYFCEWELIQHYIKLKPIDSRPDYKKVDYIIYGTPDDNLIYRNLIEQYVFSGDIEEIIYRKFSQIMYNAIEIFLKNGTSKFINFYTPTHLASFIARL